MSALPKCIAEKLDELQHQIDALTAGKVVEYGRVCDQISAVYPNLVRCIGIWGEVSAHACIYITIGSVAEAAPLLRDVRRLLGLPMTSRRDDAETNKVKWEFSGAMSVWATLTGASCRFVAIGTKEVPVYQVQCDGGGDLPTPDAVESEINAEGATP